MSFLERTFSYVCGSANVWVLDGNALPFCQRCTGLYVGCIAALAVYLFFRPRSTSRLLWLHGGALVAMIPFGYHWVPQNDVIRTITGFVFACSIVYFLLLLPFARGSVNHRDGVRSTFVSLLTVLAMLLATLSFGGPLFANVIAFLGFVGLLCFGALMSASAWCLAES